VHYGCEQADTAEHVAVECPSGCQEITTDCRECPRTGGTPDRIDRRPGRNGRGLDALHRFACRWLSRRSWHLANVTLGSLGRARIAVTSGRRDVVPATGWRRRPRCVRRQGRLRQARRRGRTGSATSSEPGNTEAPIPVTSVDRAEAVRGEAANSIRPLDLKTYMTGAVARGGCCRSPPMTSVTPISRLRFSAWAVRLLVRS
jgi:hypothetical protein